MSDKAETASSWPRAAAHKIVSEPLSFVRTAARVLFRPRAFVAGWIDGTRPAMNPLEFIVFALGVTAVVHNLDKTRGVAAGPTGLAWFLIAIGPYVVFMLMGAIAHALFLDVRTRAPLAVTVGLTLLVGGSVVVIFEIGVEGVVLAISRDMRLLLGLLNAMIALFALALAATLAAAHRVPWWRAMAAVLGMLILSGLLMSLSDVFTGIEIGLFVEWLSRDAQGHWHLCWGPGWLHGI